MREFFVDLQGGGLRLREVFAVDFRLPPERGVGYSSEGWCNASPDGGVEGIRVKLRYGFTGFGPLRCEVLAPPRNMVKIAEGMPAVIALRGDRVIDAS